MTYVVFWKPVALPTNFELRLQYSMPKSSQTLVRTAIGKRKPTYEHLCRYLEHRNRYPANNLYIGCAGTGGGDPAFLFRVRYQ